MPDGNGLGSVNHARAVQNNAPNPTAEPHGLLGGLLVKLGTATQRAGGSLVAAGRKMDTYAIERGEPQPERASLLKRMLTPGETFNRLMGGDLITARAQAPAPVHSGRPEAGDLGYDGWFQGLKKQRETRLAAANNPHAPPPLSARDDLPPPPNGPFISDEDYSLATAQEDAPPPPPDDDDAPELATGDQSAARGDNLDSEGEDDPDDIELDGELAALYGTISQDFTEVQDRPPAKYEESSQIAFAPFNTPQSKAAIVDAVSVAPSDVVEEPSPQETQPEAPLKITKEEQERFDEILAELETSVTPLLSTQNTPAEKFAEQFGLPPLSPRPEAAPTADSLAQATIDEGVDRSPGPPPPSGKPPSAAAPLGTIPAARHNLETELKDARAALRPAPVQDSPESTTGQGFAAEQEPVENLEEWDSVSDWTQDDLKTAENDRDSNVNLEIQAALAAAVTKPRE